MLDLHPQALPRNVSAAPGLRHHTIEARALEAVEPLLGGRVIARVGGEKDWLLDALEETFKALAPLSERLGPQVVGAFREDVEGDVPGRRGLTQHSHPLLGRMDSLLEGSEV